MAGPKREAGSFKRLFPLFVAAGVIMVSFVAYWVVVAIVIPQWTERGLFGDSFGALNAFVSGIALIGVVYALLLQQRQLDEMRRSIELQQQPVVVFKTCIFRIDRPRVFTSPKTAGSAALSRYHCVVDLSNICDMPAINAVVSAQLCCKKDSGEDTISSVGEHFAIIASQAPQNAELMLVPDDLSVTLFEALRKRDAFALPQITVNLVYKNLLGACFFVGQAYHLVPSAEAQTEIQSWHEAVSSFPARYQEDLKKLAEEQGDSGLLSHIQNRFTAGLAGKENVLLELAPIAGAFQASTISTEDFAKRVASVGLPHLTFADTVCPHDKQ